MNNRPRVSVAVLSVALALLVAGCAEDTAADRSASPPATAATQSADSSASPGDDASADVLGGYTAPSGAPAVTGTWDSGTSREKVLLSAVELRTSAQSSRLMYTLAGTGPDTQIRAYTTAWSEFPRIVDTTGKKIYSPNTWSRPEGDRTEQRCICTEVVAVDTDQAVTVTVQFPPMPTSTTDVELRQPGFDPIKLPVTR